MPLFINLSTNAIKDYSTLAEVLKELAASPLGSSMYCTPTQQGTEYMYIVHKATQYLINCCLFQHTHNSTMAMKYSILRLLLMNTHLSVRAVLAVFL